MTRFTLPMLAAVLLIPAIASAGTNPHVHASHAWIRVLPGSLPAGAYVTLTNNGDQPAVLKRASSPAYASVMLHHSSTAGGMSRMTMVSSLTIPAHGSVSLAPAGYHLMLMQPHAPVKPGDSVRLILSFADHSTLPTDFIARPANAIDDGQTPQASSP
jgi:copper(I)-binding protein